MNPITISALNTHILALFERDDLLRDVWVIGEVSNWKRATSGHIYFTLKDDGANISTVMWKGNALAHTWLPREGDQVLAHGYVGVYPERGVYQLYANRLQPVGRGQLYAEFEALKARLAAAGLFDAARKRPLPVAPRFIGVITSPDGAALRDILRVLTLRWPLVEVIVFPTLVQGSEAPAQIANAIVAANQYAASGAALDTLILARGGGSIEDLWAFNDERVAYALIDSQIPVITGVGHETDFTIVDFVADLRAPTPSAAAAAAVPDRTDLLEQLASVQRQLSEQALTVVDLEARRLHELRLRLRRVDPKRQLDLRRQSLDDRERYLRSELRRRLERLRERNAAARLRLDALNPANVLRRGYSIVQAADGTIVTSPAMTAIDDELRVRGAGGEYRVKRIK
ncbi:MAG: exodeoxyribonuclease VII large subunit [Chloroflexi bacterium]|nr:exodeoxyribonuclease VII large subunit [Chloroflexota bacterium]